jgi:hypothetical protein
LFEFVPDLTKITPVAIKTIDIKTDAAINNAFVPFSIFLTPFKSFIV